jgi:penicillin amidase
MRTCDDESRGYGDVSRRTILKAATGAAAAGTLSTSTALAYQSDEADAPVTVTVKRDEYGVPHVYARGGDGPAPTFYGYGYAVARDRLFQLEMYRRFYHGTVSEVLGADWVEFDRQARISHASSVPLSEQLETQLTDEHRSVLAAMVEGMNRYVEEATTEGGRELHAGFAENDFEPDPWTVEDLAGTFVASMAFFSGFQLETLGATVLDGLRSQYDESVAMDLFEDLVPGEDPGAPTSGVQPDGAYVPPFTRAGYDHRRGDASEGGGGSGEGDGGESEADGESSGGGGGGDGDAQSSVRGPSGATNAGTATNRESGGDSRIPSDPAAVHAAEMERYRTLAEGLVGLDLPIKYGSNALAVQGSVTESGDALLMGGPQMDFSTPSVMYEVGLHGPGFDVAGITVAGYPFVMFGHNRHGAFTSTAGIDNCIQTFVESITVPEDGPATYEFRGEDYEVQADEQTIPVADGDDVSFTLRRTRHGVVTQWNPDGGEAVAQTRSYDGRDMNSWRAFYDAQFAASTQEYKEAAQQCDYALNFIWAGESGDVGFFHLGRYPDMEAVPWDTRLPADGTQHELTDDDYLRAARDEVPYSVNPPAGYSANWNNKPAPGWNNGDLSYSWTTDHRVQRIINLVENRIDDAGAVDYDYLKDVVYDIAFVDLRAVRYKDALLDALDGAALSSVEQDAVDELLRWDDYRQGSGEEFSGAYPAGYTVWDRTFPKMLERAFAPTFGDVYGPASYFLTYRYGRGTFMRALHPEETLLDTAVDYFGGERDARFREAFSAAVSELRSEFGDDPSEWREDVRPDELDNMALFGMPVGVGDPGDMPFLNRGTENHFVRVGDGEMRAENVLPPGESGYLAPDGARSPHYDDQLDLFLDFEYKPLRFTDGEVAAATQSTRTLEPTGVGNGDDGNGDGGENDRNGNEDDGERGGQNGDGGSDGGGNGGGE